MSTQNSNAYQTNNEQLSLINILNTMYNDNLTQINNLQDSNNQIRNSLVQILTSGTAQRFPIGYNNSSSRQNSPQNQRNRGNSFYDRRSRESGQIYDDYRNSRSTQQYPSTRRASVNTQPTFFDFIGEYSIPLSSLPLNMRRRSASDSSASNTNITQLLQNFLQPIEVCPTSAQIEAATRHVRYCDIVSPKNTSCPISMEEFGDNDTVTVIRHCSHIFNTEQITNWFTTNCRCPVCRYDIREYNSDVTSEFYQNTSTLDISFNNILERSEEEPIQTRRPAYNSRRSQILGSVSTNQPEIEAYVNEIFGIDISGNNPYNTDTINFVVGNIMNMMNR
jgi:hypothetical protein